MLKSEDAVTLMPQNFESLYYRVGDAQILAGMCNAKPRVPFDDEVLAFLHSFSGILLASAQARQYSDVISLAFWCRKAALKQMKQIHSYNNILLGRGTVFHIAPANVAVNFAYSLLVGLLTGNANVVRLPSKKFSQVDVICQSLNMALEKHIAMRELICLVEYGHEKDINNMLSAISQARIIWGGDKTISLIRQSPLAPRAIDLAFADRYSIALINADYYLASEDKQRIAADFFNDTLLTAQQACTSPRVVVWCGNQKNEARAEFWQQFEKRLQNEPAPEAINVVKTLAKYCENAAEDLSLKYIPSATRHIFRVEAGFVTQEMLESHPGYGLFYEWLVDDIKEISSVCGDKCQTLATLGVSQDNLNEFIHHVAPKGIDRIVALGQTMNFSLYWDGYNLLQTLTRTVTFSINN